MQSEQCGGSLQQFVTLQALIENVFSHHRIDREQGAGMLCDTREKKINSKKIPTPSTKKKMSSPTNKRPVASLDDAEEQVDVKCPRIAADGVLKVYGPPEMADFSVSQGDWTICVPRLRLYETGCTLFSVLLLADQQKETGFVIQGDRFSSGEAMVRFFDALLDCGSKGEWSTAIFDACTVTDMDEFVGNLDYVGLSPSSAKFKAHLSNLVSLSTTIEQKEALARRYTGTCAAESLASAYVEQASKGAQIVIPEALRSQVAPLLLALAGSYKSSATAAETKNQSYWKRISKARNVITTFRNSFLDEDDDGCDDEVCIKSCCPGNRCDDHPPIDHVSQDLESYEDCPLSALNAVSVALQP